MKYSMKKKSGFTLVEIMIVVVIIGLLAVMAIPAFQRVRATAQTNAVMNNLRQISNAADQYFLQNGVAEVTYAQLVGIDNNQPIKVLNPVAGENYVPLFPIQQGHAALSVTPPALGVPVTYNE